MSIITLIMAAIVQIAVIVKVSRILWNSRHDDDYDKDVKREDVGLLFFGGTFLAGAIAVALPLVLIVGLFIWITVKLDL